MRALNLLIYATLLPFAAALLTGIPGFAYMSLIPAAVLSYGILTDPPSGISGEKTVERTKLGVGESTRVRVSLRIEEGAGIVQVSDVIPPGFEITRGSNRRIFFKRPEKPLEVVYEYEIRALKRGRHVLSPVEVIGVDPLRVGMRSYAILGNEIDIEVAPSFVPVKRLVTRKLRTREGRPSSHLSRMGPVSTDFREIREYHPGDPLRVINWKATARLNEPLVNEYEPEGRARVMIYLDTTENMGVGTAVNGGLESAVGLTLSIIAFLLKSDFRVGLYLVGSRRFETPRTGIQALSTFAKLLLHAGPSISGESFPLAVERSRALLEGGSTVSLFVTNLTPYTVDEISRAVERAVRFTGKGTIVVDVNPYHQIDGIVGSLTALQKRALAEKLGVPVVHWNPAGESLPAGVKKVLWVMLNGKI